MREPLKGKELKLKIEEGWIHAKFIFQLLGSPKEHVEKTIRAYVTDIATRKDTIVISDEYEKAEKTEGELWSSIAEVDVLTKDFTTLTFFCINFMPASVEIIAPKEFIIKEKKATDWLSDMLAKLHEVSVVAKAVRAQNEAIVRSINTLAKNYILHLIDEGVDSVSTLEDKTGMDKQITEQFLAALIKEGRIKASLDKLELAKALGTPTKEAPNIPEPQKPAKGKKK
jgi:hypothetical protein